MAAAEVIKSFNSTAKDYFLVRSERTSEDLVRMLQFLGSSSEVSAFDPGNIDAAHFFVNLHHLMFSVDPNSTLAWAATCALQAAARNSGAQRSLIHFYNFAPVLAKYATTPLTHDKHLGVLRILLELTYNNHITWQESHLTPLIAVLTESITQGSDVETVSLSLGVLVNLCYKNLPAVYTLMRAVNIKNFLKTTLKLQKSNDAARVQACKLMIILECVNDGVPDSQVKFSVESIWHSLTKSFNSGQSHLMRNSLNFFEEIIERHRSNCALTSNFPLSLGNFEELLSVAASFETPSSDCMAVFFDLLCFVVKLPYVNLETLYQKMLSVALRWIRAEMVAVPALNLICSVAMKCFNPPELDRDSAKRQVVFEEVLEALDAQLPNLLLIMEPEVPVVANETHERLTALMELLSEMVKVPKFSARISSSIIPETFKNLFKTLQAPDMKKNSIHEEPVYKFYVQALTFLAYLSDKETSWLYLYNEFLEQKQTQTVLAIALYMGSVDVKERVLTLVRTTGFSPNCSIELASCMTELNKLVVFSPLGPTEKRNEPSAITPMDINFLPPYGQEQRINQVLEKYEAAAKTQAFQQSPLLELYQYRVATLTHTNTLMQKCQEAADQRATGLQHSLALTSAEVSRLYHLLHATQQSFETVSSDNVKLTKQISETQQNAKETFTKYSELVQTVRSKTRIITELNEEVESLKKDVKLKDSELAELNAKLNASQKGLDKVTKELELKNQNLESLKKELLAKSATIAKLEQSRAESENEAAELFKHVQKMAELAAKRK